MTSATGRDIALSFVGGFLAAIVLISTIAVLSLWSSDAYGLGHWKLNARMPLASTWMNLGYWYVLLAALPWRIHFIDITIVFFLFG